VADTVEGKTMSNYNGWTNRETWLVNLWFGDSFTEMAEDGDTVDSEFIESHVTDYVDEIVPSSSFIADMVDMNAINWEELAEHYKPDEPND